MLTKEITIIEPFLKKPWEQLTFKQVKTISKNKSDNYVHKTLKKLVKNKILKQRKIANIILYSLDTNLHAQNTIGFIAENKTNQAKHIPHKNLQKLVSKLKTPFYSLIITGSYAKNKQKSTSDLDIVIICDDKQQAKIILSQITLASELMHPEIHPYVFTRTQLFNMLTNKLGATKYQGLRPQVEQNYGKEIVLLHYDASNDFIMGFRNYNNINIGI